MKKISPLEHDEITSDLFKDKRRGINLALEALWRNRHNQIPEKLSQIELLEAKCLQYDDPNGLLNCQIIKGQLLVFMGQSEEALEIGKKSLEQFKAMRLSNPEYKSVFELRAHNFLGAASMMSGRYGDCLEYWNQGILMVSNMDEDPIVVNILHNLAELYRGILYDAERALELYNNAIEWAIKFSLPIEYMLKAGRALCLAQIGRVDEARHCLSQILSESSSIIEGLPTVLKLLYFQFVAHTYLECQEYNLSLQYANQGLEELGEGGDSFRKLNYKLIVARSYVGLHLPLKALETSQYFLELELESKHDGLLMFIYKVMAQSFGELGQWKDQAHYANLCVQVTEREFKERMDRQAGIASAQAKQHLLQKDLEIHQLRNVALKEKSDALEKTAWELSQTLNELILMQQRLVESEKLAALGRVVSGVAHEINTPLGVACSSLSYLEGLLSEDYNENRFNSLGKCESCLLKENADDAKQALDLLDQSLKKVSNIVSRFREISAKHAVHEKAKFDVLDLLTFSKQMALTINKPFYKHKLVQPKVMIHMNTAESSESIEIYSYPSVWQDITIELITNAIMHNSDNPNDLEINITFEMTRTLKDDNILNRIKLVVADNGLGIPIDFQPQVFEPFSRVARHKDHMGLGLHSLHNLVIELLDGDIRLDANEQGTTRFIVEAILK